MRLLLDTHCWLWMGSEPKKLGRKTRGLLENLDNELVLSLASVWEIAIKVNGGKLRLPLDAGTFVRTRLRLSRTSLLPIELDHTLATVGLPNHHRDPFDRMLVAQAQVEGMTIVTSDPHIAQYAVLVHDARR